MIEQSKNEELAGHHVKGLGLKSSGSRSEWLRRALPSSLRWRHFFRNWSASDLSGFCVFLENDITDLRQIFFKV